MTIAAVTVLSKLHTLYNMRIHVKRQHSKRKSRVTTVKAQSKTRELRDKDGAMKTETNTTRSTYEIKENTHKTKSK